MAFDNVKILFFILLFYFLFSHDFTNAQHVKNERKNHQIGFYYWNDNLLFEDIIDQFIGKGEDDHVTASFLLEYLNGSITAYWNYNLAFNILTNKKENDRTDLINFSVYYSQAFQLGNVKFGLGMVANGNFGGSVIQNNYHDLFGYPKLELPYLRKSKIGLLVFSEFRIHFIKKQSYYVSGNVLVTYATDAYPSKFLPGLIVGYGSNFQLNIGYVNYYKTNDWLRPLFKSSAAGKLSVSKKIKNSFKIGLWFTKGIYGIEDEFHYGLNICFGLKSDIIFHDTAILFL